MNILFATSEVVPFSKTGGLADVSGALPQALAAQGHDVTVVTPAYRSVEFAGRPVERLGIDFIVGIGGKTVTGHLLRSTLPGDRVSVILVQQDQYYDRGQLYGDAGKDYIDNCERFVFFSRAVLEVIRLLGLNIDLVHANDWQTGLVPAYLDIEYRNLDGYREIATLMTIHNMAFQGTFWHWDMLLTGIDWKYFNWHQMEFHDNLNLLKTGVVFADSINTVSPRYAQEIQTHPLGCGLEGVLSHRSDVLTGIVNGVDYSIWNPALDHHLPKKFGPDDWEHGKRACKLALQQEMTLPENPDVPVVGIVGRLTDQKGFDLVSKVMMQWAHSREVQWVILGTGQPKYHEMLQQLASEFPQKVAVRLEFSDPLAHRIEAGADMFLMPSRFEPCGLNQMYSLKYGTVPIVRTTGGLADTVTDTTADSLTAGTATGFRFGDYSELALEEALARACEIYTKRRDTWNQIVVTGMCQDWSWERSARQYGALYEQTTSRRRQALVGE